MSSASAHSSQNPLTFTFQSTPSGRFELRFADVCLPRAHLRLNFTAGQPMEEILKPELVAVLRGVVARVQGEAGTLVIPDLGVSMRNVVLSHATIIVSRLRTGLEQVVVWFREATGMLLEVFKQNYGGEARQSDLVESLKNSILYSLYLPLINVRTSLEELIALARGDDRSEVSARLDDLHTDISRLSLKCERVVLPKLGSGPDA